MLAALACLSLFAAQTPQASTPPLPPIRAIGPIEHVTRDSLLSVTAAVPLANGKVLVHDILARRVLLLDSTLSNATVVADSAGGAASAYGNRPGTLLPFHGDSALLISPASLGMLVISPTGTIVRTMAMPPSTTGIVGAFLGNAGFDAQGRMLYVMQVKGTNSITFRAGETGPWYMIPSDTAFIVRFDFGSRALDTIAVLHTARNKTTVTRDEHNVMTYTATVYPAEIVDDWTVTRAGTVAVVRGRDLHIDWLGSDGKWSSTPRVPYGWDHLDDAQKRTLIDSAVTRTQFLVDSMNDAYYARAAAEGRASGSAAAGRAAPRPIRNVYAGSELSEVADYRPAIRQASTRADAGGNLWIRTTLFADGRPVYDVVNPNGELTDRVELPAHRGLVAFGPGVVYLSVLDSNKVAHLERARIK